MARGFRLGAAPPVDSAVGTAELRLGTSAGAVRMGDRGGRSPHAAAAGAQLGDFFSES